MTPAELNALAARVETEAPSEELRGLVLTAIGSEAEPDTAPDPLRCLDDAAALMPDGWHVAHITSDANGWYCGLYRGRGPVIHSDAPTLAQAWTAAALRARAIEMDSAL